jgi:hypothetical protein
MRVQNYLGEVLSQWLIEIDEEEPRERVFFRNGKYYYENTETDEFILVGEWDSQPSGHEWVSPVTIARDGTERAEYCQPAWNIGDSMGSWEPDPTLWKPYHWLCSSCHTQMPKSLSSCDYCA